jgi:hypothetical protein
MEWKGARMANRLRLLVARAVGHEAEVAYAVISGPIPPGINCIEQKTKKYDRISVFLHSTRWTHRTA